MFIYFRKFSFFIMSMCVLLMSLCCCKNDNKQLQNKLKIVLEQSSMFDDLKQNILQNPKDFVADLDKVIEADKTDLLRFVDKKHLLSSTFAPLDLISVEKTSFWDVSRPGHSLRKPVYDALSVMCQAAKKDGLTMLISSTYRSYQYQDGLYNRYVSQYGQKEADTFSARPGSSQHQLGVVIDFGEVEDSFALTKESKWLEENAKKFGFSLSFPKDFDEITGFKWECWQYRYLGLEAVNMQEKWFGDIQHFLLEFIYYWKNYKDGV